MAKPTPEDLGLEIDIGNLLLSDPRPLASSTENGSLDALITEMTQLSQILLDRVWALPLERAEDAIVAVLPPPTTILPRAKPIPKAKPMTKWERYAKEKGITKQKKSRMVHDPMTKEWKPRWGYGKAVNPDDDWVTEVPAQAEGMDDPFEERQKAKKERVAKNELQRLKNIARAHKTKIPAGGILPNSDSHNASKQQISHAAAFARTATASAGKFTENLPKEKPPKNIGKKRKFESNLGDAQLEKTRMLDILNGVTNKKARVEVTGSTALGRVNRRSQKPKRGVPSDNGQSSSFRGGKSRSFSGRGGRGGGSDRDRSMSHGKSAGGGRKFGRGGGNNSSSSSRRGGRGGGRNRR